LKGSRQSPFADEAFARKLDLLGDDVWIAGTSSLFKDRLHEALGAEVPIHRGPPERGAGTLLLELRAGDLYRPGYFADLQRRIQPDGKLWIVLPKKAHAEETEFPHTWDEVQRAALRTDLVDNKIAAFSDELTAVRFVIRRSRRPGAAARGAARNA
jgi:hypothetical protein